MARTPQWRHERQAPDRSDGRWNRARLRKLGAQALVIIIAGAVLFSIGRSLLGGTNLLGGSKPAARSTQPRQASPSPPKTVPLNNGQVPVGEQAVLVLNPGLVRPGAAVSVSGYGFDPRSRVDLTLAVPPPAGGKKSQRATPAPVASATAGRDGSISTQFTMPSGDGEDRHVVIAQQRGSDKRAQADAVSAAGAALATVYPVSGRPGDRVTVTAEGFGSGESVNVYWGRISGTPTATLQADGSGNIGRTSLRVGVAVPGDNSLFLVGVGSRSAATAQFLVLGLYPVVKVQPYAAKGDQPVSITGRGFAPGEPVLVYVNSSGGAPALTLNADDSGNIGGTSFRMPFGLKGQQSLVFVGQQSRASVHGGFSALPYTPSAQPSTYGAMPGTSISFYVSGFAPNEAVHVYAGGTEGSRGDLVTAFRVDGKGTAGAAGSYVIPGNAANGVAFTLLGTKSQSTATANVTVEAAKQPVNIPPQPKYSLPPDLTN